MPVIPPDIEGLGDVGQRPRPNPQFNPTAGNTLTSQDFFVFSRIDGSITIRDLVLMTGLGVDATASILRKLHEAGAFMLDGETVEDVMKRAVAAAETATEAPPEAQSDHELSAEERAALEEDVDIKDADKRAVLKLMRAVRSGDLYAVLGVPKSADKRALKRAYFKLSKKFHPDRYYSKNTGSFGPWLSEVFEAATRAWNELGDERKRAAYDGALSGAGSPSQTPEEHAAELFERAAGEEARGNLGNALMLFSGAVRADPRPRYLRRAASCAARLGKFDEAEGHARRALEHKEEDPSYWRVLADVYRAAGRLEEAAQVLARAAEIRTENDVLAGEIAGDLAAVKRELGR